MKLMRSILLSLLLLVMASSTFALTTYTIGGTSPDYATITAAVTALNALTLTDAVQFNIRAGTYSNPTETYPLNITKSGTATFTIKFVPETAGTVFLTNSSGASTFALTGADYVTIDGLSITMTGTLQRQCFSVVSSTGGANGATYNTISNCSITMDRTINTTRAIYQNVAVAPTSAAGANSFNTYRNLTIHNCQVAIRLLGNATYKDDGIVIEGCQIGVGVADDIMNASGASGVFASDATNLTVRNNVVANVTNTVANAALGSLGNNDAMGIRCYALTGTNYIYGNKVSDIKHNGTAATNRRSAIGIYGSANAGHNMYLFNNMVWNLSTVRTADTSSMTNATEINPGFGNFGIIIATGTHYVYHNTVLLNGNTAVTNAALWVGSGTNTIYNNVFANTTATQTVAKHYAIAIRAGTNTSNYNDLYVANSGNGYVGYLTSDYTTLANWQGATGTPDLNSVSGNPLFISTSDLHIQAQLGSPVSNAGTNISAIVSVDIDGQSRSTTPDLGADEGNFAIDYTINQGSSNPAGTGSPSPWTPSFPSDPSTANTAPLGVVFGNAGAGSNPDAITARIEGFGNAVINWGVNQTQLEAALPLLYSVNRLWDINVTNGNGFSATVTLHFTAAQIPASITNPTAQIIQAAVKHGSNPWVAVPCVVTGPDGNGVYTATISNMTQFSLFGLGIGGILPVQLSVFRVEPTNGSINVRWRTESEVDNDHFILERTVVGDERSTVRYPVASLARNGNSVTPIDYYFRDNRNLVSGTTYRYRLSEVDFDGRVVTLATTEATYSSAAPTIPTGIDLLQAYPNPFNSSTTIDIQLREAGFAKVAVYDISGRLVKELFRGNMTTDRYKFTLRADNMSSGIYLVRITSENFTADRKLVYLR